MNSSWFLLALAVTANVSTNFALKKMSDSITFSTDLSLVPVLLGSAWFWLAGASGITLLAAYVLALRTLELSDGYAIVTSAALVGITIAGILLLGETASWQKGVGTALIIAGILVLARS